MQRGVYDLLLASCGNLAFAPAAASRSRRVRTIRSFAPGITRDNSGIRGMPTLASGLRISSQLGPVETIPQTHRGPHGLSMIRSVKRAIVGMSGDPSNIRLMFVYRRARRVRWRLPPPPPSPPDTRTPGSRGANSAFFFEFQVIAADLGRVPKKTRRGRGKAAASVQRIVSRTGFRGPGLGASADSGGRRFGLRNPERSTGSRCAYARRHPRYPGVIPCYPGYKTFDRAQGGSRQPPDYPGCKTFDRPPATSRRLKSFQCRDAAKSDPPDDPGNPTVNFPGERRRNDTHQSTTDPAAMLHRKGQGKEAKLAYLGPRAAGQSTRARRQRLCDPRDGDCRTRGGGAVAGGQRTSGQHGRGGQGLRCGELRGRRPHPGRHAPTWRKRSAGARSMAGPRGMRAITSVSGNGNSWNRSLDG